MDQFLVIHLFISLYLYLYHLYLYLFVYVYLYLYLYAYVYICVYLYLYLCVCLYLLLVLFLWRTLIQLPMYYHHLCASGKLKQCSRSRDGHLGFLNYCCLLVLPSTGWSYEGRHGCTGRSHHLGAHLLLQGDSAPILQCHIVLVKK